MIVPAIGFEPVANGWSAFAPAVRKRLEQQGVSAGTFEQWRTRIVAETDRRERDGEGDHLIHYALLSRAFADLPAIEPALSAKKFHDSGMVPVEVKARLAALQRALIRPGSERLREFQLIAAGRDLQGEYARAMRFLYAKEFQNQKSYAERGHSTDTAVAANYAVWQGLNVLHASVPAFQVYRVLIVGPGLDFAPRTGLIEMGRPQSYQPFAVLDALLSLKMFGANASIRCWDINPRVIRFFQVFRKNPTLDVHADAGDQAYQRYFAQLGTSLGAITAGASKKVIQLDQEWADKVSAEHRNIVTDEAEPGYDFAVATNVLLYYQGAELTVALAHIAQCLKPGGYLLHNDLRAELDGATQAAGLEAVAARTVRISATAFDSFALYRR